MGCFAGALETMQQSSEAAALALRDAGAGACTDVTGFGLLGHLAEMARASQVCPLSPFLHWLCHLQLCLMGTLCFQPKYAGPVLKTK